MKNLFEATAVNEVHERIGRLTPQSQRLWGKMTVSQMFAHCSESFETALARKVLPRMFIGRLIGPAVKRMALGEKPMARNSPTHPTFVIHGDPDFDRERQRLTGLIDDFAKRPAGCGSAAHTFFGPMTPEEWARLMYRHLDHHLKQFGA